MGRDLKILMPLKSINTYIIIALKGFCMGAADVVPGVSGGTMALILGIYETLINAIRSFNLNFLKLVASMKLKEAALSASLPFLLPLILGILSAILSLAKTLSWLLDNHPVIVWSFFFGLVLSSIFTVGRTIREWKISCISATGLGAVSSFFLFGLIPLITPDAPWFIFFSGFIAICAMILPGISGAYILVLLGKYHYILEAVNNKDFLTIFILLGGALIGILSFVRIIGWFLRKYHDITMAVLIGLMIGSLRRIWPWKETVMAYINSYGEEAHALQTNILPSSFDRNLMLTLFFMIIGFALVLIMDFLAKKTK